MNTPGPKQRLAPYIELVSAYVERGMPTREFQQRYEELYLNDETDNPEKEYVVLETLFGDVDAFVSEPGLSPEDIPGGTNEDELRAGATRALARLRQLADQA